MIIKCNLLEIFLKRSKQFVIFFFTLFVQRVLSIYFLNIYCLILNHVLRFGTNAVLPQYLINILFLLKPSCHIPFLRTFTALQCSFWKAHIGFISYLLTKVSSSKKQFNRLNVFLCFGCTQGHLHQIEQLLI